MRRDRYPLGNRHSPVPKVKNRHMNDIKYNSDSHHRRSIRLPGYDYAQAGAYFVTVVAHERACLFGEIVDGEVILNDAGKCALSCWHEIPSHFPHVVLDEFAVMPNHVHGIIFIKEVGVQNFEPLRENKYQQVIPRSIGSIVRGFKIGVTKWFKTNTRIPIAWQRNYYEHVILDDDELNTFREYIINNPAKWQEDEYTCA
jgi:putative transposase